MFIFKDHSGANPITSSRGGGVAPLFPLHTSSLYYWSRHFSGACPFTLSATGRITTRFLDVV